MKKQILLAAIVVAALVPFSNKPFFIDDYYHFLMAKGILDSPARPYDFLSDDDGHDNPGWERGALPRMVNPPAMHYYTAALIKIFGESERALHLGFLVFPVISALCLLFFGSQLMSARSAFLAALLLIFSPVFWISSTGLTLDSVKLTFYLAALALLAAGVPKNDARFLAASGFFMGAAILAKYTAVSVLAVSLLYLVMFDAGWKKKLWIFVVPAAMLAAWSWWNVATYGSPHIVSAAKRVAASSWNLKFFVALIFLGGGGVFISGILPVYIARPSMPSFRRFLAASFFAGFFGAAFAVLSSGYGGFSKIQAALIALWLTASSVFFVSLGAAAKNFSKKDAFLAAWFVAVFLMSLPAMNWTAGRYFMAIMAPAALLFVRLAEILSDGPAGKRSRKILTASLAATFVAGALLAAADYTQASVYKKIRDDLRADAVPPSYFKSDIFSGITGYLKKDGWRIVVPGEDILMPGDLFLVGYISTPVAWIKNPEIRGRLRLIKIYEYKTRLPLRLVSVPDSAGFYATCWGALPWSISTLPLERYRLYVVEKS